MVLLGRVFKGGIPQAAGGRLYSDTMGRLTFIKLLVIAVPVGCTISSPTPRSEAALTEICTSKFNRWKEIAAPVPVNG